MSDQPRHPSAGNLHLRPATVAAPSSNPEHPRAERQHPEITLLSGIPTEKPRRLFGDPMGRRFLELGADYPTNAVLFAQREAKVVVVDPNPMAVDRARHMATDAGVSVEFHVSDFADLAFLRVDYIDAVLACGSLQRVRDIGRVFRQAHRVMKPEAPIQLSLYHPVDVMVADSNPSMLTVDHPAWDEESFRDATDREVYPHSISSVINHLIRANFRIDSIEEVPIDPASPLAEQVRYQKVYRGLVIRARKQGI